MFAVPEVPLGQRRIAHQALERRGVGKAPVSGPVPDPLLVDVDGERIELHLDDVHVVSQGGRRPEYREEDGARVMAQSEITIRVGLGRGEVADTVWTCDFSHDYVTINADYRS